VATTKPASADAAANAAASSPILQNHLPRLGHSLCGRAGIIIVLWLTGTLALAQANREFLQALRWRSIGPNRGGRATAVTGLPNDPLVYYMGATGGGVWKTVNAGLTWTPVSDGYFNTGSVGSIAVSESDPNIVYVGMGEACLRSNLSHGDGVYKSTDGGRTWQNVGLRDTSQIGRVWVDPRDPKLVYVAAVGHPYGANPERGAFRSKDGGGTWQKILFINDKTGAVDLAVDPHDTRIMYAATWQVLRRPWDIYEFGPGAGIYKTTDGGDTWTQLRNGLPKSEMGKIGLAVSPVDPHRLWATIGGDEGGVYRSDDAGQTWQLVDGSFAMHSRQYYYGHIFADPEERDTVYTFSSKGFYKSTDAGQHWEQIRTPHSDYHGLWIDPRNNQRMVNANDGGATVTFDGGRSWTPEDNQATAQFYTVRTDNDFPYHVYGAQQDNTTVMVSSASRPSDNEISAVGGGESGYVVPDPGDSNIVYAGAYWGLLTRYDRRTGLARNITVWPDFPGGRTGAQQKYRFQWTYPIAISPADPGTVYVAANVVFKSVNGGQSWIPISPDLTRDDKQHENGGRLEDVYDTVFTLAPSPLNKNLLWAGSDDGLIHMTRDGGKNWANVTPPALEPWTRINIIEASSHDPATAYVAANRYQLDDFRPYIYRTHDFGKTWTLIVGGIPQDTFVRTVRQDPANAKLLYAGTETGVYVSFDDGEQWYPLQLNLPIVPITDLTLKDGDLVASTQGRAFWILDDITPLEQMTDGRAAFPLQVFKPRPAYRMARGRSFGSSSPTAGMIINYYLAAAPSAPVKIAFLDADGTVINSFSSDSRPDNNRAQRSRFGESMSRGETVSAKAGLNRFIWDMRYADAEGIDGGTYLFGGSLRGPEVAPGQYHVRVTMGEQSQTQSFEIRREPRVPTTLRDYRQQVSFLLAVRDKLSAANHAINRLLKAQEEVQAALKNTGLDSAAAESGRQLNGEIERELHALYEPRFTGFDDQTLIYPLKLNNRIAALESYVGGDYPPTDEAQQVLAELSSELERVLAQVRVTLNRDLSGFHARVHSSATAQ